MKHRNSVLLYFSFKQERQKIFWETVHKEELNCQNNALFRCGDEDCTYSSIANLIMFLNNYGGDYQSLHIIIDIMSFKTENRMNQIDSLRDAVLSFPEVQFLFDYPAGDKQNLLEYLFYDEEEIREHYKDFPEEEWADVKGKVFTPFLETCWEKPENGEGLKLYFYRIICGRDNTFDGTNLRYAIKYWKYVILRVDKNRNFNKVQDSRSESIAICVEEETNQNMFTSYALYQNGYRVIPIASATELKILNKEICSIEKNSIKNVIIIRDYDLQFEDEGKNVDLVRGYKHCTKAEIKERQSIELEYYDLGWTDMCKKHPLDDDDNFYWNNLVEYPTYFITKGPRNAKVELPLGNRKTRITGDKNKLILVGLKKPISGIYIPFHKISKIKQRFRATRQMEEYVTTRNKHDHSTPLDIYDMINIMLKRAESYYENGRFRLAALICSEAIEIMNGFHQRLMVKAIYLKARSENAIVMDVIGGDEEALAADALFRIDLIKDNVNRIYLSKDESRTNNQASSSKKSPQYNIKSTSDIRSINVLNRIYSDCRKFCKEHEHFVAENRFLSAIGHLNEGYSIGALGSNIITIISNIKETYKEMVSFINDNIENGK